jgi:hypothetical protein
MDDSHTQQESNLIDSISKELIQTSLDLGTDYSELVLDSVFNESFLKEIPFVKTIYSLGKIGYNIKERFFVKKMLCFPSEFHNRTASPGRIEDFKNKFESDPKYKAKVTELIMVYNDSFLEIEKSKIFAKLFIAYISNAYDWNHFRLLSSYLGGINLEGVRFLAQLSNTNFEISEDQTEDPPMRDFDSEALLSSAGIGYTASSWSSGFYVTEAGKDLYKFGIKEE